MFNFTSARKFIALKGIFTSMEKNFGKLTKSWNIIKFLIASNFLENATYMIKIRNCTSRMRIYGYRLPTFSLNEIRYLSFTHSICLFWIFEVYIKHLFIKYSMTPIVRYCQKHIISQCLYNQKRPMWENTEIIGQSIIICRSLYIISSTGSSPSLMYW